MNNKAETPEVAIKEAMQPETPESPGASRNTLLDALVKSNKKVTVLEDVLSLAFDAAVANAEGALEGELVDPSRIVSYLLGVKDAYEAIYGPIVR